MSDNNVIMSEQKHKDICKGLCDTFNRREKELEASHLHVQRELLDRANIEINKAIFDKDFDYCSGNAIKKHIENIFITLKAEL